MNRGKRIRRSSPEGRPEGSLIKDYVVEDHADHELLEAQESAIKWAEEKSYNPLVPRVGHLNDKKILDHWRSA